MSTLAQGLTEYHVPDYKDHAEVIARLSLTVSDLARVQAYWRSVAPGFNEAYPCWTCVKEGSPPDAYLAYYGPGGFSVHFGRLVACVGALCRFSSFATIRSLQSAYLPAFKSIARVLGGTRVVLMPEENAPVWDAGMYQGASLDEYIALVRSVWGEPHPRTEVVTDSLEAYYRRKFPVWYVESVV